MIGYRWFIICGAYGSYVPHEYTFSTYQDACKDAERIGYAPCYYGVNYVDDGGESVTVVSRVKQADEVWWEPEDDDD